jgi:surface antigen
MLYIRRYNRKSFRRFKAFSLAVKFHLVVVLCLPLLGLTSGVYVKEVYAQGRVLPMTHTTHGTEIPLARAVSPSGQCCVTARQTTYLKQRNSLGKLALKRPASQRTPPCCVAHNSLSCCAAPTHGTSPTSAPSNGAYNWFPYPSCTWWADQRYYQLHGTYVPWRTQANASQWTARAYQYGWHVSSVPSVGAIIDLQPWVQGAYGMGHVAIVEQVLSNGSVIASNSSWGGNPYAITYVHFSPGPGVTFITW